jgi:DNA ligase (NAD+)
MKGVELSKLQHASGKFNNLGSKKLVLLEGLENPTISDICKIEGFSDISASAYLDGLNEYNKFISELNGLITIKNTEIKAATSSELEGRVFVFTGVRRDDLESIIESRGGKIGSSVNGKTTDLIIKQTGSGSSKEKKAEELGINIMSVERLEKELE